MRAAADHEDQTEKHVVVPGPILPARELLGDLLMELGQPAEALSQYEASITKNQTDSAALRCRSRSRTRRRSGAVEGHFEKLVVVAAQSDVTRPELAHAKQVLSQR
jgi:hypothetical protein